MLDKLTPVKTNMIEIPSDLYDWIYERLPGDSPEEYWTYHKDTDSTMRFWFADPKIALLFKLTWNK